MTCDPAPRRRINLATRSSPLGKAAANRHTIAMRPPASAAPNRNATDLAIVGGGLAGGLIALAFARWRPDVRVTLVEAGERLGGNHVWSVFASDVDPRGNDLIAPLVAARWDGYDIAFPDRRRTLATGYASLTSDRLDAELRRVLGLHARTGQRAEALGTGTVTLAGGDNIEASAVIDTRGAGAEVDGIDVGWQKFVGQLLRLDTPHQLARPVVMDATVDQIDGYRFVYVLPFDAMHVFVEDTYYSDTRAIDRDAIAARIAAYAAARGWTVAAVEGEEQGALPVVIGGRFDAVWPRTDRVARAGARAGMFHPTTGYSLPDAVRFAIDLVDAWPMGGVALADWSRKRAERAWTDRGFYRLLDTMLYRAATPTERWRVLSHFYRLPEPAIERFYAGRSTAMDRIRVLSGRPPVPISNAVRAIAQRRKPGFS